MESNKLFVFWEFDLTFEFGSCRMNVNNREEKKIKKRKELKRKKRNANWNVCYNVTGYVLVYNVYYIFTYVFCIYLECLSKKFSFVWIFFQFPSNRSNRKHERFSAACRILHQSKYIVYCISNIPSVYCVHTERHANLQLLRV